MYHKICTIIFWYKKRGTKRCDGNEAAVCQEDFLSTKLRVSSNQQSASRLPVS